LRDLAAGHELPAEAAGTIADVLRMLGQARRAVAERPSFLTDDNDRMRALLAGLIPDLPPNSCATERIRTYLTERANADPG
jgi:hypothetical protein